MYFLAHVAQFARQHQLHLRVNILHPVLNHKLTLLRLVINRAQFLQKHVEFLRREKSDGLEHGDVCHTAQHIILGKIEVHLAVSADGELLYLIGHADLLGPYIFNFMITHSSIVTFPLKD